MSLVVLVDNERPGKEEGGYKLSALLLDSFLCFLSWLSFEHKLMLHTSQAVSVSTKTPTLSSP